MKLTNLFAGVALTMALAAGATGAQADVSKSLHMEFQSGAVFDGTVTFVNDYSMLTDVSGLLSGGPYGSDPITWIWSNGANFSTGADNYSDFLMDGPSPGGYVSAPYNYFIQLAYNYSAAPLLTFTTGVSCCGPTDNYINYTDPMVRGSFGPAGVPEPATWAMMLVGFGGLGAVVRRAKRNPSGVAAAA